MAKVHECCVPAMVMLWEVQEKELEEELGVHMVKIGCSEVLAQVD